MRGIAWFLVCVGLTLPMAANAETTRVLGGPRVHLGDLITEASGALAAIDLGATPPPGSSRLFSREDLRTAVTLAHESLGSLAIPDSIRVVRSTRKLSTHELDVLIRPALAAALPEGALLKTLDLPKTVLGVPNITAGRVHMSRLPKRVGMTRTSAVVELVAAGQLVTRLPVTMDLQLDERASQYLLERGASLALVIDTGMTRVSAAAVLMAPADIGDVVSCQVTKTRKVLRAKIVSRQEASVVLP
jgi:hypothetical protein